MPRFPGVAVVLLGLLLPFAPALAQRSDTLEAVSIGVHPKGTEESVVPDAQVSEEAHRESRGAPLAEQLSSLPGVRSLSTGKGIQKPILHGLYGQRVLILVDGLRLEGQAWGQEHGPEMDAFVADQLRVEYGASSVRYGSDAIAGAVLVEADPLPVDSGFGGVAEVMGRSNGAAFAHHLRLEGSPKGVPLGVRVQGTYRQAGTTRTPRYWLENTALEEYNVTGSLGWQADRWNVQLDATRYQTTVGIFRGSHIGNLTDLQNALAADRPNTEDEFSYAIDRPYQSVVHNSFRAKGELDVGFGTLHGYTSYQIDEREEFDVRQSSLSTTRPALDLRLTTWVSELSLKHRPLWGLRGELGWQGIWQQNIYQGRQFIPNFTSTQHGVYLIERRPFETITLESGLRYDRKVMTVKRIENNDQVVVSDYAFDNLSAQVGAILHPQETWDLHVVVARGWRAPHVAELFSDGLHHGAAAIEEGDSTLGEERVWSLTMSYSQQVGEDFSFQLVGYRYWFDGYIALVPTAETQLTIRGAFPTFAYTQVPAVLTGLDAQAQWDLYARWRLLAKASLLHGWDQENEQALPFLPPQQYEARLRHQFGGSDGPYVKFTAQYTVRQHLWVPTDYAPPPEGYWLFGLHAGTTLQLGNQPAEVGLGISNLFNNAYRDYLNRLRYYADEAGTDVMLRVAVPFGTTN